MSAPSHAGGERPRLGDVALDQLGSPRREPRRPPRIAHERAHRQIARTQRVHDVAADEAGAAGDENRHSPDSKFLKYRLGVGPVWPLYFDPISEEPYGVVAGSVICMNEICPIFIPG